VNGKRFLHRRSRAAIRQAVQRVCRMERCFDELQRALQADPRALHGNSGLKTDLRALTRYYEGSQWLRDYALDEKGFFPRGLKRGVLAQDALYDFFEQVKNGEEPQL